MCAGYTARGEVGRLMAWATGPKSIYVRIEIRGPMDRLWELTQTPELHERWDLRFSEIRYLPRVDPSLPQRFLYRTRIGFGLAVSGEGETVGNKDEPGRQRTSALKFWSDDAKSLIRRGSGYWQYVPLEGEGQRIADHSTSNGNRLRPNRSLTTRNLGVRRRGSNAGIIMTLRYGDNGSSSFRPTIHLKSSTLWVTRVREWTSAVAATSESPSDMRRCCRRDTA